MKTNQTWLAGTSRSASLLITLTACMGVAQPAAAATVALGTAINFAVLGGSTVTNTGSTVVSGNVGVSPGTEITGFPPGSVNGTVHTADAVAEQAQNDAQAAYIDLAGRAPTQDLTGQDLGGLTLTPGVYFFSSSAQLTGTLTLDGQGLADPLFIFQIGSTLTTASDSSILGTNSADSCDIFFVVGSSATLGTDTNFEGTILATDSITLNTGSEVDGRLIALNGAVTLDANIVDASHCIPETSSAALGLLGAILLCARRKRSDG